MLTGKIVLVTGATRHTGYDIAAELLRHGAIVYVNGRKPADLERVVKELGDNARPALADLSQLDQIEAMVEQITAEAGRIDVLVNNACHLGVGPGFLDTPMDLLDDVMAVNFRAVFRLCQLVAAGMVEQRQGAIVNISSNTADRVIRNRSTYIASKGANDALTRAMAVELAPHGVRVNTLAPGYIRTTRWEDLDESTTQRRHANIPLGYEALGTDVGQAVVFLASDMSRNITGAKLTVDGGVSTQLFPADAEV